MEEELKKNKLLKERNLAFSNDSVYGLTKKIKVECFTKSLKSVQHFEVQIQICLKDKLVVVSDSPDKNNIFALEEAAF